MARPRAVSPTSAIGAAAAVGGLALLLARLGQKRSLVAVSGSGLMNRNLRLARLGARGGSRYALHKARRTFASVEVREQLDEEFQLKTAEDVTRELGNMKGAMMKLGQMASYIDTGLPDNVKQTLASLQHDAPPMSAELAAKQIEAELGAPPETVFLEWDPVPIASASIGQVHRAITRDDRAVAVKVQYPGVAEAVKADLGNAGWIFAGMANMFPGLEPGPLVEELKERLVEELDYTKEAKNQRYFASFFDRHPYINVPGVIDHLSTSKVLTTDLAEGERYDVVKTWSQEERNLAAETVFRFSFGSIYRLHAFNGDPHPGNYLFQKGGKVTFLDFGLVKRFEPAETALFEKFIVEMVINRDLPAFRAAVESANLLAADAPISDAVVGEYFEFFYRYLLEDKILPIDDEYAADGVAQLFDKQGNAEIVPYLNVPPSFVVLQRITLGLIGLFAGLEAEANWRRIAEELWPFVDGPASTPMGRNISEWRSSKNQPNFGL